MDEEVIPQPLQTVLGVIGSVLVFVMVIGYAYYGSTEDGTGNEQAVVQRESPMISATTELKVPSVTTKTQSNREFVNRYLDEMANAEFLYTSFCASCHGSYGEERTDLLLGSDLFDGAFAFGGTPSDVVQIIAEGKIDDGMTPMKGILDDEQIASLAAYIFWRQSEA
jgi:mono/diheme cytochrome c family protein